jgi:hypothetical protein
MHGVIEIKSNGSKWYREQPDKIEKLFERLDQYQLDKRYTRAITNGNSRTYRGNFIELSAVFQVGVLVGSQADKALAALFKKNRARKVWNTLN